MNPFTCLGHAREIVVAAALCAGRLREFLSKDSVLTIQEDASSYRATRFSGGGLNCSRTHIGVHSPVKKRDLEKALKRLGWQFLRHMAGITMSGQRVTGRWRFPGIQRSTKDWPEGF